MITHFWYRFGRTNSLEDVKVFLMSLWVLIRKDEERMSYAENYGSSVKCLILPNGL